jgi:hypothetical protein
MSMKWEQMAKQSTTYQQLQTIMTGTGCPICRLSQQAVHSYLASLLWESVNDPAIRQQLNQSLGFCGSHSRELLTFNGEWLGVAIIQRSLLQEVLRRISDPASAPARPPLLAQWQEKLFSTGSTGSERAVAPATKPCPACVQHAEVEARGLETILKHLHDDLAEPLRRAGGLCLPHLEQALAANPKAAVRAELLEIQQQLWSELVGHLDEAIRKYDHRFRNEKMTEAERLSVERAIYGLTGEEPAQ